MLYLASPYSHPYRGVRELRRDRAAEVTAILMAQEHVVYSPIAHSCAIEPYLDRGLVDDHDFWMRHCLRMLQRSAALLILPLPGVLESKGVAMEFEFARNLHMNIHVLPRSLRFSNAWPGAIGSLQEIIDKNGGVRDFP